MLMRREASLILGLADECSHIIRNSSLRLE